MTKPLPTGTGKAMKKSSRNPSVAVWAVTPGGLQIAERIARNLEGITVYAGKNAGGPAGALRFESLADAVEKNFAGHEGHIFVMAAGIAIRMIAPLIQSKQTDPAVVAVDDTGKYSVSLLSGHLGGANTLARKTADIIGASPVITTATDRAGAPAIDMLAAGHGLETENQEAVRAVSMALVSKKRVQRYDPYGIFDAALGQWSKSLAAPRFSDGPGIYVYHETIALPENVLVLRPASLAVGVGCNSGTSVEELCSTVDEVFKQHRLAIKSIRHFATISEKASEPGLREMAACFARPLKNFDRAELAAVKNVPTPSEMVEKHMGVKSVCEAAAILAAQTEFITVPKHRSRNVTIAVAALPFI